MAGLKVNKAKLSEILGVSERSLTEWQNNEGLPHISGSRGESNEYDTAEVIEWLKHRAVRQAGKGESQRDREARLRGDMLEIELAKERKTLVPTDQIQPIWESRVLVAAAFQKGRASRLAGILEAAQGIEAKRAILKKEDAEFLTRLGVDGEQMQAELEALLGKVAASEAEAFLKRMASYDGKKLGPDESAEGGVEGTDPSEEDPA